MQSSCIKTLRNGWDYVLSLWENLRRLPFNTLYLRFHICQMRKFILVSFFRDTVRLKGADASNDFLKMVQRISSFLTRQILSGTFAHSRSQQLQEATPIFRQGRALGGVPAARMPDDPPPCSFRGSWAWFNIWTYAYAVIYITVQRRIWRWKNKRVVYPKEHRTSSSWKLQGCKMPVVSSPPCPVTDLPTLCVLVSQPWSFRRGRVGRWNGGKGLQKISNLLVGFLNHTLPSAG